MQQVLDLVEKLSSKQRIALIKHLLGCSSGLTVVFENNLLSAQTIFQVQHMNSGEMSVVLKAIAEKVRSQGENEGKYKGDQAFNYRNERKASAAVL